VTGASLASERSNSFLARVQSALSKTTIFSLLIVQLLNVDSAEKPHLNKKQHLKTPPKHHGHHLKVAYKSFVSEVFSTLFAPL